MKALQSRTARPLHSYSSEISDALRLIRSFLQASDASQYSQQDLDAALPQVNALVLVDFYTGLIRSTFVLKIEPALASVVLTERTLPSVLTSLAEGLERYQACWRRLAMQEYDDVVTTTFQALVRRALPEERVAPALQACLGEMLSNHFKVMQLARPCYQVGLRTLFQRLLKQLSFKQIGSSISNACSRCWDKRYVDALSSKTIESACTLLSAVEAPVSSQVLSRLESNSLAKLRISELFDMVAAFPASTPALEDLRHCLQQHHDLRASLVSAFTEQCVGRLMQPGAKTADIISFYVLTIKAFTLLDPPGVLLDKVGRPIRQYLRERGDTIRCIVTSLLNEEDVLSAELGAIAEEEVDDEADLDWEPTPVDASPDYMRRTRDLLGSLISIYEHREVFVKELQVLLADRLLASSGYEIEGELRNLELLKRRFGGAALMASADVMVQDIADSKQLDQQIQATGPSLVHATILSRMYWPRQALPNLTSILAVGQTTAMRQMAAPVKVLIDKYTQAFETIRENRTLCFLPSLGQVRVELALEDRAFDLLVTPAHASIIYQFSDVAERSLAELVEALGMTEAELRRGLSFWIKQGILQEARASVYAVIENTSQAAAEVVVEEVGLDLAEAPVDDDMDMYWQFIVGMLTNVGALPLARIQSMLGMFAPSYDRPQEELGTFLAKKMREGAVQLKGGMYKLAA